MEVHSVERVEQMPFLGNGVDATRKLLKNMVLYQGTASAVLQMQQNKRGL